MEDKKMVMEDVKKERDRIISRVMGVVSVMQLENILGGVAQSLIGAKGKYGPNRNGRKASKFASNRSLR